MSSSEQPVHYTTLPPSSTRDFDYVDPTWLYSGDYGPLPPFARQSQIDATAAGQQDTPVVKDRSQASYEQRHNSHNSHSLRHATPDRQAGRTNTLPGQQRTQSRRTTDGVCKCSECHLVFQKRHLLKYVNVSHCRTDLTLIRYPAVTSGCISLPTSAHTTVVRSASARSETLTATSSQSTLQRLRSEMTYFALARDACTQKGKAKYARGRTIWPDTSVLSMREARRFRMPCEASCKHQP